MAALHRLDDTHWGEYLVTVLDDMLLRHSHKRAAAEDMWAAARRRYGAFLDKATTWVMLHALNRAYKPEREFMVAMHALEWQDVLRDFVKRTAAWAPDAATMLPNDRRARVERALLESLRSLKKSVQLPDAEGSASSEEADGPVAFPAPKVVDLSASEEME